MTSDPRYRALFLGAGPQMQCGIGQFTRLLDETIEKHRTRQLHFVNPDAVGRVIRRYLARRRLGTKRGLQLSDRGLEARDRSPAAGAGYGQAAATQDCPDSARMGRAALAAPHHLSSRRCGSPIPSSCSRRWCAANWPRIRWSAGPQKMRAGAAAAEHRGAGRDRRFEIAAAPCRRARGGPAGDRPFRIDLSGQATQRAARYRRTPESSAGSSR